MILKFLFPENLNLGTTSPIGAQMQSFVFETILTFILMLVILFNAHGSKETGIMAGIAIGYTVLLEAMFAGPISGASMNPARSAAPAIVSGNVHDLWIYIIAPITGTTGATLIFKFLHDDQKV